MKNGGGIRWTVKGWEQAQVTHLPTHPLIPGASFPQRNPNPSEKKLQQQGPLESDINVLPFEFLVNLDIAVGTKSMEWRYSKPSYQIGPSLPSKTSNPQIFCVLSQDLPLMQWQCSVLRRYRPSSLSAQTPPGIHGQQISPSPTWNASSMKTNKMGSDTTKHPLRL
jgi:hypothetical protein